MLSKNHLYLFIIFMLCILSRVFTSIYYIEDTDSLRFALSLIDYDLVKLQPHFPGYPFFCFIAKTLYLITNSMGVTFSLIGGTSVFLIIYYVLKFDRNEINSLLGVFLAFIIFYNPLIWLMSNRYMPDILGLAIVTIILYQLIRCSDNNLSLHSGYFLSGLLAGTRLSYLPIIIIPFINQLINNPNRIKLISSFILGILIWLIPLIWITGLDNLWIIATKQTYGHFMDFGGSIITENSLINRFSNLVESIWADGLGGYWIGRSLDTAIFSFFLAFIFIRGLITIYKNWKFEKYFKILLGSLVLYLVWIFLFQNVIYKARHILPVLIILFIIISSGFHYILEKRSTILNVTSLLFCSILIKITTTLVLDHKNPTAISQLKDDLIENNISKVISTPLINYYLKSNNVKATFINIDKSQLYTSQINKKNDGKILMIGDFKSLFDNDFIIKPNKSFFHNHYINRMWSEIDTYVLIQNTNSK